MLIAILLGFGSLFHIAAFNINFFKLPIQRHHLIHSRAKLLQAVQSLDITPRNVIVPHHER